METDSEGADERVTIGATVYAADGTQLGTVRGIDDDGTGMLVSLRDGVETGVSHVPGGEHAPAELTWGCSRCGEIRRLDGDLPEECPGCGAPREDLYYRRED